MPDSFTRKRVSDMEYRLRLLVCIEQLEPIAPDQLMQLLDALRLYYRAGAPAGNAPVDVLIAFIKALKAAADAARAGSTGDLLIATNAVASAGLQAQSILASFLQQQEK